MAEIAVPQPTDTTTLDSGPDSQSTPVHPRWKRLMGKALGDLFKRSTLLMGSRLSGAAIGFITQLALARLLGAESLGMYYLAISLGGVLAILAGLGYPSITVRFISEYRINGEWHALRAFLTSAYRTAAIAGAALIVVTGIIVFVWPTATFEQRLCLTLGALTAPAFTFIRLNGAIANAYRRYFLSFLPDLLVRPAVMLAIIGALIAVGVTITVPQLLALNLIIVLIVSIPVFLTVRQTTSTDLDQTLEPAPVTDTPTPTGSKWRVHGLPMVVVALFTALFADVAILTVGIALPPDQTAIFGVCIKIALLLGFAIQSVHQLIMPDAADAYARGDKIAVQQAVARGNLLSMVACLGATGGIVLFGSFALSFFGEQFEQGYTCLIILALSQVYRAGAGPVSQMLNLAGKERKAVPVFATCLVLLVALGAGLTPYFGLNGAAASVFLITALWTTWLAVIAKRHTGVQASLIGRKAIAAT